MNLRDTPETNERQEAESVIRGLLEIAQIAMPDTYYAEDSRVVAARQWLGEETDD